MPYIAPDDRTPLDEVVHHVVDALMKSGDSTLDRAGCLNYTLTRICSGIIDKVSYKDICVLTGVLENVKQELYRRAAAPYEELKIYENGDVAEYKYFEDQDRCNKITKRIV